MTKTALITGITGQDGSYLTDLLLEKGYVVHGVLRRGSMTERPRLDHIALDAPERSRLHLHYTDLNDPTTLRRIVSKTRPDELYHLAGQSHVGASFEIPESTAELTAMGTLRLLEIVRDCGHPIRMLNIGSSEIFGRPDHAPQTLTTPMVPVSPYGASKAFAVNAVRIWREAFGIFAVNAICYNHESPRRGLSFVTRKIARGVARIAAGDTRPIALGSLDVARDWGWAPEYVEAMWRMLQADTPTDLILATGQATTLQAFLVRAFESVGLDWQDHVISDPRFVRPAEPVQLFGDASEAASQIDWRAKVAGTDVAELMVRAEITQASSSDLNNA